MIQKHTGKPLKWVFEPILVNHTFPIMIVGCSRKFLGQVSDTADSFLTALRKYKHINAVSVTSVLPRVAAAS